MKILVSFKSVPDPNDATIPGAAVSTPKSVINPFDEIAIEEALRIRERGEATEIVGVTIGVPAVDEQIRAALAMGVDRAIRIDDSRALDPYAVARILGAVVKKEAPHVVIMGKQAVDDDSNQVGQMLAGLLGWPQATFVSKIEFLDNKTRVRCTRETDAGLEVVEVNLPAIITTDLRLNEPRYVSLPGLIKARRKPIEVLTCDQLGVTVRPLTTVLSVARPPKRAAGTRVESVEELITKLNRRRRCFSMAESLILIEHDRQQVKRPSLHAIALARQLGGEYALLVVGHGLDGIATSLVSYGASAVIVVDDPALAEPLADRYAAVIAEAARKHGTKTILGTSSTFSKDVLPRAAALLDAPMVTDVVAIEENERLDFLPTSHQCRQHVRHGKGGG